MIAIIVGLFIAGLAYLQYQQLASFDWNRIEALVIPPTEPPAADVQLPPSDEEPLAAVQFEQGQPDVQPPGDDESPEEEGSESSNN
ncbi:MAG: hypothetical protein GEU26_10560 [Nitrososphaeraceae archaeon]|nr:hypothetical protein [Nitrososphaeraceae archaeon]